MSKGSASARPHKIGDERAMAYKYRLARSIGRGSFGEVWLAQDQAVNHEYAINILNAGIGIDQRLRAAQVGHEFTQNNPRARSSGR